MARPVSQALPTELRPDRGRSPARAFVRWQRKKIYFGEWQSEQAAVAFAKWLTDQVKWLADQVRAPGEAPPRARLTVAQCVERYLWHASTYYARDGQPTQEFRNLAAAADTLLQHAGGPRDLADEFGPRKLKAIQAALIAQTGFKNKADEKAGRQTRIYSRTTINARIHRIRRIFRWCVSEQLVPPDVITALDTVSAVAIGRTEARETQAVKSVPIEIVVKTLPYVSPTVSAMARVQLLCGMRPQDVCGITGRQVDTSSDVWLYRPTRHKTDYLQKELIKAIPAPAQSILKALWRKDPDEPIFSPDDSVEYWRSTERRSTTTPRPRTNPRRPYTTASYGKAIAYGVARAEKAGVQIQHWRPNQLRHSIATIVRQAQGLESSQHFLGHSKPDTTLIYAETLVEDLQAIARQIVSPFGPTPPTAPRQQPQAAGP